MTDRIIWIIGTLAIVLALGTADRTDARIIAIAILGIALAHTLTGKRNA